MSDSSDQRGPGRAGPQRGADDGEPPSRRGPMIALGVVLLLVVAGILLTNVLRRVTTIQDCVMAGRRNCAPVQQQAAPAAPAR